MDQETQDVLRETRSVLRTVKWLLAVTILVVISAAGAATYTGHVAYQEVRHACSASHLGIEIGKLTKNIVDEEAEQKRGFFRRNIYDRVVPPISKVDAERQREAVARIFLKNVMDGRWPQCPDVHVLEKLKIGISRWRGTWKSEVRFVEGDAYARDAIAGKYKHPWPEEWACANNYQANWNRQTPRGTVVGTIGSMTLYCQDGSEKPKRWWQVWVKK